MRQSSSQRPYRYSKMMSQHISSLSWRCTNFKWSSRPTRSGLTPWSDVWKHIQWSQVYRLGKMCGWYTNSYCHITGSLRYIYIYCNIFHFTGTCTMKPAKTNWQAMKLLSLGQSVSREHTFKDRVHTGHQSPRFHCVTMVKNPRQKHHTQELLMLHGLQVKA